MQSGAINLSNNDIVYRTVQNVSGATLSAKYGCVLDLSASVDGVRVTAPATATLSAFVGVAAESIANNAYGRVIAYGLVEDMPLTSSAGSSVAGDLVGPANGTTKLAVVGAASATAKGFAVLCSAIAASSSSAFAVTKDVFVRAL